MRLRDFMYVEVRVAEKNMIEMKNKIDKIRKEKKGYWADPEYKELYERWSEYHSKYHFYTNPTVICSAISHLRGKLHMKKIRFNTYSDLCYLTKELPNDIWRYIRDNPEKKVYYDRDDKHIIPWTLEDQKNLIQPILEAYRSIK